MLSSTIHLLDAETGERLLTVALPYPRDAARLLDHIHDAAREIDGIDRSALLSYEVGDEVWCEALPVTHRTALQIWQHVRHMFCKAAPLAPVISIAEWQRQEQPLMDKLAATLDLHRQHPKEPA